jgi:hypothetical protein
MLQKSKTFELSAKPNILWGLTLIKMNHQKHQEVNVEVEGLDDYFYWIISICL